MPKNNYYSSLRIYSEPKDYVLKVKDEYYNKINGYSGRPSNSRAVNKIFSCYLDLCKKLSLNPLLRIPKEVSLPAGQSIYFELILIGEPAKLFLQSRKFLRRKKIKLLKEELIHFFISDFMLLSQKYRQELIKKHDPYFLKKHAPDMELIDIY